MKVTIVTDEMGEWEALYVDGVKFTEGHSLTSQDWINLLRGSGIVVDLENKYINNEKYDYDYMSNNEHSEPTFYEHLEQFEDDDFQKN